MTKLGTKVVGLLKLAPYYLVFLSIASAYSVYSNQYPEYEWWQTYASIAVILTALSAIGIWYEQKWSIATVIIFVTANTFIQLKLNHSTYFFITVFSFIVWAQIEKFILTNETS